MPRSREVTNGQSATPTKNAQASPNTSKSLSGDQDDTDFDPAAEGLVEEMDDEVTLDEEEALDLNNTAAVQEELDQLKKESEMPIDELRAHYQRLQSEAGPGAEDGDDDDEDIDDEDEEYDEEDDMEDEDEEEEDESD